MSMDYYYNRNNCDYLKIKDSEFIEGAKKLKKFCNDMNQMISEYKTALVSISENELRSGATHDALLAYIEYVEQLDGKLSNFGDKYGSIGNSYINKIDKADRYLYEMNGSAIRDFSGSEYDKLIDMVKKDNSWWNRLWDGIGDFILGKKISWFNSYDVTDAKANMKKCHEALLDYNDATKSTINNIWNAVYSIEHKYGHSISGCDGSGDVYTACFSSASLFLYRVKDAIDNMAELINPNGKPFTVDSINSSLKNVFSDIDKYYDQVINIVTSDIDVTFEVIEKFANSDFASLYFKDCTGIISDYLADIGGKEYAMTVIFNMFDISDGELVTNGAYEQSIIKEELLSILDEMAESYVYEKSDEKQVIKDFKDCIELVKKYGENWYKAVDEDGHKLNIDGRTKEGKKFKEFLDGLGGASEILKYGDDAIEVLAKCFADYSDNLDILQSLLRNYQGSGDFANAAKEIEELYKKQLSGMLKEAYDKIREVGFDEGMKLLSESLAPIKVVQTVKATIGTIGEVTGLGEKYKNMYNALIYQDMYYSSVNTYYSALEKVQKATKKTGEAYEKLLTDLKNTFNITKNVLIKMFTAMAKSSSGNKRAFYEDCAYRASESSMFDRESLNLGSYH